MLPRIRLWLVGSRPIDRLHCCTAAMQGLAFWQDWDAPTTGSAICCPSDIAPSMRDHALVHSLPAQQLHKDFVFQSWCPFWPCMLLPFFRPESVSGRPQAIEHLDAPRRPAEEGTHHMMHDPVVEGIHAAGNAKEGSQKHDCHKMRHSIACSGITALQRPALPGSQQPIRSLKSEKA